jgi:hypothetical protein
MILRVSHLFDPRNYEQFWVVATDDPEHVEAVLAPTGWLAMLKEKNPPLDHPGRKYWRMWQFRFHSDQSRKEYQVPDPPLGFYLQDTR